MKRKYVHVKRKCECGCGEEIGLVRSDRAKKAKLKSGHIKNKRKKIYIDEKCECGCGEEIGHWLERKDRNKPRYKPGHYFKGKTKPEKKINSDGYVLVYKPHYKSSYKNGYILEHRYVMELFLGRYLTSDEDVHHVNRDKKDNRIENLKVINHLEHSKIHTDMKIKEIEINEIERCFKNGMNIKGTCEYLGVSHVTLHKFISRNNLEKWYRDLKKKYGICLRFEDLKDEITKIKLRKFNKVKDISKHLGIDRNTTVKYLKKLELYDWFNEHKRR